MAKIVTRMLRNSAGHAPYVKLFQHLRHQSRLRGLSFLQGHGRTLQQTL